MGSCTSDSCLMRNALTDSYTSIGQKAQAETTMSVFEPGAMALKCDPHHGKHIGEALAKDMGVRLSGIGQTHMDHYRAAKRSTKVPDGGRVMVVLEPFVVVVVRSGAYRQP